MNHVNLRYTNFEEMNLPTSSPIITDSRIRFSLANIYFWQDDYGWSYKQTFSFGDYLYNKFVVNQSNVLNKDNSIHIFMSEDDAGHGMASGIGNKRWITLSGIYACDTLTTFPVQSQEINKFDIFRLYPNPVKDVISISNLRDIKIKKIEIFDLSGSVVKKWERWEPEKTILKIESFKPGIYLLKIETEPGIITEKLIVE